ncbi:hypothetical protein IJ579_09515 [bacterium]|nr:hypothetical protein [bacterium]
MILPVNSNFNDKKILFGGNEDKGKKIPYDRDTLLENNFSTRSRIALDKLTKSFTVYPAKGLKGSINSNFYEFLTMGIVPYLVGSGTLMAVFNSANKYFSPFEKMKASSLGNKMALGVLFYGLFKSISQSFTNLPVKWITGIDTQLPYAKVNYQLQERPEDSDLMSIEYHKVGESVDFTRWDLLYKDHKVGNENEIFDKIAKKNGLGENLNDSDQEVKPIYKEVLVKSNLARTISSYMWAATGVALAFQKPWENYFRVATLKFWKPNDFIHSLKVFGESFVDSAKELYKGREHSFSKLERYSGKLILGTALGVTILGVLNAVHLTKKPAKVTANDVMDKHRESVVS